MSGRAMCRSTGKILTKKVTVALVGKYIQLHDAYISVVEALKHGGVAHNDAMSSSNGLTSEELNEDNASELLGRCQRNV